MLNNAAKITPYTYHAIARKALDNHNDYTAANRVVNKNAGELSDLQSIILECLKDEPKGLRSYTLMCKVRKRTSSPRFHNALDGLINLKYIIRTRYKRSVFYSITLDGRAVLDELNEILISIVHNRPL